MKIQNPNFILLFGRAPKRTFGMTNGQMDGQAQSNIPLNISNLGT